MEIPVWHDDQQGTGTVVCAGLMNALKIVGKKISEAAVCMLGAGAACIATARIIIEAGVSPGNIVVVDSKGMLRKERTDLQDDYEAKWDLSPQDQQRRPDSGLKEAIKGADVLIAMSHSGPGIVPKEMISSMNDDSIVFACANPKSLHRLPESQSARDQADARTSEKG